MYDEYVCSGTECTDSNNDDNNDNNNNSNMIYFWNTITGEIVHTLKQKRKHNSEKQHTNINIKAIMDSSNNNNNKNESKSESSEVISTLTYHPTKPRLISGSTNGSIVVWN